MTFRKIVTNLPLLAGIAVLIASAGELAASWQKATAWVPAKATVVGNGIGLVSYSIRASSGSSRKTATAFIPEYKLQYRYQETTYEAKLQIGNRSQDPAEVLAQLEAHPEGSNRQVFVNPSKPIEAVVNAGFNFPTFESALGGLGCGLVFLLVYAGLRFC
jgi:hypothetical protein